MQIRAIFYTYCDNFNPCGILEKMTSFINQDLEQGKFSGAVNCRK